MKVKAVANDVGISPQKLRLVVNTIRGRKVDEALTILRFMPTPTARAVAKIIKSAVANAENNFQMSPAELRITDISADKGHCFEEISPSVEGENQSYLETIHQYYSFSR